MAPWRWNLEEADFARLAGEFRVDDHSYWPADDDPEEAEPDREPVAGYQRADGDGYGDIFQRSIHRNPHLIDPGKSGGTGYGFDYRQFLRKFSVLKEESGGG